MNDEPPQYLSAEEMLVLKFAARRQLTRWSNKRELDSRQQAQRAALRRVLRILDDDALARGCELHRPSHGAGRRFCLPRHCRPISQKKEDLDV